MHLESYVNVTPQDAKIFRNNKAIVLFQLIILETGEIESAGVVESCVLTGNFDPKAERLEKEILKQVCLAGKWNPGVMDGKPVNMNIYIPIKFSVEQNRIMIFPSKYLTVIKDRKNK
jgi:hypothetical protein